MKAWLKQKVLARLRLSARARQWAHQVLFADFPGSGNYWELRYHQGGNSGSGSYGRLAHYKAQFLNQFFAEQQIETVLEFGCGDGHNLGLYQVANYIGLDVSRTAIQHCIQRYQEDAGKSFFIFDPTLFADHAQRFQVPCTLSLDVIYHLVEDGVFEAYMRQLFGCAQRYVVIYASNFEGKTEHHMRPRQFTQWIERHAPQWRLLHHEVNPYHYTPGDDPEQTSEADFYLYTLKDGDA
ncbi:hypothetical protein Mmc1_2432 [Magnetococcus marinus MC-1]|uniref:Uncharacterized protein n=1 Tax=Magnetococcus marinus (strain ATCC BAA-1437 / JCM 17883 / MC-1) TaxID=156889 RepID=A0LAD9_MAGMM|nr:class I SAM-dependent methyltransferase [Magnetococcus marinus]ABK44932.1 hypothetical protein Mmc1_2432 [Magnetococcus marinus MC-1]